MKYTAYITRFFQMAEESLEVIIDDVSDFSDFKNRCFDVFRVCDYRANLQARRLFEDTSLTQELRYEDLQKIRKAVDILFPHETLPKSLNLNSDAEEWEEKRGKGGFQFTKSLKDGEILKVFLHEIDPEEDANLAIRDIYHLIDTRLQKTNKRETDFVKYLKKQDMNMRTKITMILDVLYKRTEVEAVIQRLKGQAADETIQQIREDIVQETHESAS